MKHTPTVDETVEQTKARQQILAAANRRRSRRGLDRFGRRHLERAVCVARRHRLVTDEVLVIAGFRPARRSA